MQRVLAVPMSVVVLLASCGPTPTDTTTPADDRRLLLQEGKLSLFNSAAYRGSWCKFFRSGSDFVWNIPEFR